MTATVVSFGEWLPDQPKLGNPGLTIATNVLPREDGYTPFRPLGSTGGAITISSIVDSFLSAGVTKGAVRVYAAAGDYYVGSVGGPFSTRGGTTASTGEMFAQFDNLVIGVGDDHVPKKHTVSSASVFATLATGGTAPFASVIGIINRFVVLANLGTLTAFRPTDLQWSGIDQPESWPTPNSATAIAQQSGLQEFPTIYGDIFGIHGGDQRGIVLQKKAITRMTYVGPPNVFQFDLIDTTRGCLFRKGSIKVGDLVYFISEQGFFVTDGVSVSPIGTEKINRYFWGVLNTSTPQITMAYETYNALLYIAFQSTAAVVNYPDRILIYNPKSGKWTICEQQLSCLIGTDYYAGDIQSPLLAFSPIAGNTISAVMRFSATAGTATITTADLELNPGGRAYVDGIKPNIESSGTAPAVTVRLGSRNDLGTTPSYTATTTPTVRTGFADFRVDAKYHRAEVQIIGNFEKATGIEFKAFLTGET